MTNNRISASPGSHCSSPHNGFQGVRKAVRLLACLTVGLLACSPASVTDDLTSPLDFQLPDGVEMHLSVAETVDGRLEGQGVISGKRLTPGPFPGTGDTVARFDMSMTWEPVNGKRLQTGSIGYQRIDASAEVTLGLRITEVNGRPDDDLELTEPPYVDLQAPLTLGSSWEFRSPRHISRPKPQRTMFHFRLTVQAKELTVVVPAGRFERCLRIVTEGFSEQKFPLTCGDSTRARRVLKDFHVYFCPGAGNLLEYVYERYGDPGRPDPACPTNLMKSVATRLRRIPAAASP